AACARRTPTTSTAAPGYAARVASRSAMSAVTTADSSGCAASARSIRTRSTTSAAMTITFAGARAGQTTQPFAPTGGGRAATRCSGQLHLPGGDSEAVSRDQRKRVAMHPGVGSVTRGRRQQADAPREPTRLTRAVAATIVLDPPAGHRDRAEARSVFLHGVEHSLAQPPVEHDRTRFDAPQLDRQGRDRNLAVATKPRHRSTGQRNDRLVGLVRPDDVAGAQAARRATPAAGLPVPAQLGGRSARAQEIAPAGSIGEDQPAK